MSQDPIPGSMKRWKFANVHHDWMDSGSGILLSHTGRNHNSIPWKSIGHALIILDYYVSNTFPTNSQGVGMYCFSCEMYLMKTCPLGHLHLQSSLFYCRSAKNCKENVGQPKTKVCKLFSRLKVATCITEVFKLNRESTLHSHMVSEPQCPRWRSPCLTGMKDSKYAMGNDQGLTRLTASLHLPHVHPYKGVVIARSHNQTDPPRSKGIITGFIIPKVT